MVWRIVADVRTKPCLCSLSLVSISCFCLPHNLELSSSCNQCQTHKASTYHCHSVSRQSTIQYKFGFFFTWASSVCALASAISTLFSKLSLSLNGSASFVWGYRWFKMDIFSKQMKSFLWALRAGLPVLTAVRWAAGPSCPAPVWADCFLPPGLTGSLPLCGQCHLLSMKRCSDQPSLWTHTVPLRSLSQPTCLPFHHQPLVRTLFIFFSEFAI